MASLFHVLLHPSMVLFSWQRQSSKRKRASMWRLLRPTFRRDTASLLLRSIDQSKSLVSANPRDGEINCTSWSEELQHPIGKGYGYRQGNSCGHFGNLPQEETNTYQICFVSNVLHVIIITPSHGFYYPHMTEEEAHVSAFAISNSYRGQKHDSKWEKNSAG